MNTSATASALTFVGKVVLDDTNKRIRWTRHGRSGLGREIEVDVDPETVDLAVTGIETVRVRVVDWSNALNDGEHVTVKGRLRYVKEWGRAAMTIFLDNARVSKAA